MYIYIHIYVFVYTYRIICMAYVERERERGGETCAGATRWARPAPAALSGSNKEALIYNKE